MFLDVLKILFLRFSGLEKWWIGDHYRRKAMHRSAWQRADSENIINIICTTTVFSIVPNIMLILIQPKFLSKLVFQNNVKEYAFIFGTVNLSVVSKHLDFCPPCQLLGKDQTTCLMAPINWCLPNQLLDVLRAHQLLSTIPIVLMYTMPINLCLPYPWLCVHHVKNCLVSTVSTACFYSAN